MNKISVIMPSYLSEYAGAATDRQNKFVRAVNSFLEQEYSDKELIIISDGCEITNAIVKNNFYESLNIKLIELEKQPLFSGSVRETGLRAATGEIICYVDSDDFIGEGHLQAIVDGFKNNPECTWVYMNDFIRYTNMVGMPLAERDVYLAKGVAGTSCIAHKNLPEISWTNCSGYGHDWTFIKSLMDKFPDYKKITGAKYVVCHLQNNS